MSNVNEHLCDTLTKTEGNLPQQSHFFNVQLFVGCIRAYLLASGGCQHGGGDYHLHFAGRQIHILSAQLWDTFQCSDVQVRQRQLISFCLLNMNTRESRIFDVKVGQKSTFQIKTRIFGHCKSKGPHASGLNPSEIQLYKLFIIV